MVEALTSQVLLLWDQRYISQPQRHRQLFLRYMWALIDISERRYWQYRGMIRWKAKFLPQLLTSFRLGLRVLLDAILLALLAFILLELYSFWTYYICITIFWFSHGRVKARTRAKKIQDSLKHHAIPLLSALVEFQKAQCFFCQSCRDRGANIGTS